MRRALVSILFAAAFSAGFSACGDKKEAAAPPPRDVGADSIAYFCNMLVDEHPGPKGQVFLTGRDAPYWFASARDAIAFTMLPGEPKNIAAIYVTDVGRAKNWDHPEPGTWVDARKAFFVIGSRRTGGMGAAEAIPFSEEQAARDFAAQYGGRIVRFADMPPEYILSYGVGPEGRGMDMGQSPPDNPREPPVPHDEP